MLGHAGSLLRSAYFAHAASTVRHLSTGESFSLQRTFSKQHVDRFVLLTGDSNPIHQISDQGTARSDATGIVVPGMLLSSMFPAIIGSKFPGALYLSQTLKFRRSAAVGMLVTATVTVAKASGSRVVFDTVCKDESGETLVDGTALALLGLAPGAGSPSQGITAESA